MLCDGNGWRCGAPRLADVSMCTLSARSHSRESDSEEEVRGGGKPPFPII